MTKQNKLQSIFCTINLKGLPLIASVLSIPIYVMHLLVFRKKDLYLIITQKLTFMKSGGFQVKSGRFRTDFRWNPPDFERPIARNGKPCFFASMETVNYFDNFNWYYFNELFLLEVSTPSRLTLLWGHSQLRPELDVISYISCAVKSRSIHLCAVESKYIKMKMALLSALLCLLKVTSWHHAILDGNECMLQECWHLG